MQGIAYPKSRRQGGNKTNVPLLIADKSTPFLWYHRKF